MRISIQFAKILKIFFFEIQASYQEKKTACNKLFFS